jgi:sulfatase maturation enzyme AslB (radical SAM superfamily)
MGKVTGENASFGNAAAVRFRAEDLASQQRAKDCRFFTMCHQGCPQHRTDADGLQAVTGSNVYCGCVNQSGHGYNSIWTHMLDDVEALLSRSASLAENDTFGVESQPTPSI